MDVYQEPPSPKQEEAQVHLLEVVHMFQLSIYPSLTSYMQWYVPICSLFNGCLVNKHETPMPETPETSGREIKHKVFLFNNLILLVIKMKFMLKNTWDYFAQVLLELVCKIFSFFYL